MFKLGIYFLAFFCIPLISQAEMKAMDDLALEESIAQAGISIELEANISASSITYTDTDGLASGSGTAGTLSLENIVIGGSAGGSLDNVKIDIDVDGTDGLVVHIGGTNMMAVYAGAEERMDFGIGIGEININDTMVVASDINIVGNLGPTDLVIANDSSISLDTYFEITDGSLDLDVIGVGIDNLYIGSDDSPIMSGAYAGEITVYQQNIVDSLDAGTLTFLETTYAQEISDAQDAAIADNSVELNALGDQAVIDNQADITQAGDDAVNSTSGQASITQAGDTAVITNSGAISGAGDTAVADNSVVITNAGNTAVANNSAQISQAGNTAVTNNQGTIIAAGNTAVVNNQGAITAAGNTAVSNNQGVITQAGDDAVANGQGQINTAGDIAWLAAIVSGNWFGAGQARADAEAAEEAEIRNDAETATETQIRTDAETVVENQVRTDAESTTENQIRGDAEFAEENTIRNNAETTTENQIRGDAEAVAEAGIRNTAEEDEEARIKSEAEAQAEEDVRNAATASRVAEIRQRTKTTVLTQYAQSDSLNGVKGMGYVSLQIGTQDTSYIDRNTGQRVDVTDALRIDIRNMNLDISADLSMGSRGGAPAALGTISVDNLDMSGSSIEIFGLP